ncbi:MAG TPA: hypothetical protein ENJ31_07450 [Anaerolineae bacterium]|nr:hypothetical protein [Anaerolineae bacterium]
MTTGSNRDPRTAHSHGLDAGGALRVLALVGLVVLVSLLLGLGSKSDGGAPPVKPTPWSGWKVLGLVALTLIGLLAMGLVLYALFRLLLAAYSAWREQAHQRQREALALQQMANQLQTDQARAALEAARLLPWTEHGRLGALVRQTPHGWQVVNLDAEAGALLLGQNGGVERLLADPLTLAQLQARHDLEVERARAAALPNLSTYTARLQVAGGEIADQGGRTAAVHWPSRVLLRDLVPNPATLGGLVLGVTISPGTGVPHPVTAALADLVHIAVGGSSGWGKSVFLRAMALQLATAAESCRLALIDLEGTTFAPFPPGNGSRRPGLMTAEVSRREGGREQFLK